MKIVATRSLLIAFTASCLIATAFPSNASDIEAARVSPATISASCGKPARQWKTITGSGKHEADTEHLWYPQIPAEIMLIGFPHDDREQFRYWTFYGGSPSITTNDMYDYIELARKMPCVAKWANTLAAHASR